MNPLFSKGISLRSLLYYTALIAGICLLIGYSLFQARFLIIGPRITFQNDPTIEQTQRVVTLEGVAENIVRISLNGRSIYTDKSGYFKEALVLENGYTIATLQADDRYGRSRSYSKEFVYISPRTQ